jgi:hypothetical protein
MSTVHLKNVLSVFLLGFHRVAPSKFLWIPIAPVRWALAGLKRAETRLGWLARMSENIVGQSLLAI